MSAPDVRSYIELAPQRLRVWPGNPRKTLGDVGELAQSIERNGVLEPLLVRPLVEPEGEVTHEVLAGQRRYHASLVAGLSLLPCMVRAVPDDVALELGLVENSQRSDVDAIEEAEAIHALLNTHGRSVATIADRLGRSEAWVRRRASLVALVPAARTLLRAGRLTLRHAQLLASVGADVQEQLLARYAYVRDGEDMPTHTAFARDIVYLLKTLSSAPFDVDDATLPGGACGRCAKRSGAQGDLFATGRELIDSCLDTACWTAKSDATWARAERDAKRRGLPVLPSSEVFHPEAGGRPVTRDESAYRSVAELPKNAKLEPVALTRDPDGRTCPLYDAAEVDALFEENAAAPKTETNASERAAERERERAEAARARLASQQRLHDALRTWSHDDLLRLAAIGADDLYNGLADAADVLGLEAPQPAGRDAEGFDAWARRLPAATLLRVTLVSLAMAAADSAEHGFAEELTRTPSRLGRTLRELLTPVFCPELTPKPATTSKTSKPATSERSEATAKPSKGTKGAKRARGSTPTPTTTPAPRAVPHREGERITLDGIEVELLASDAEGFTWRTTESDPKERDEGEVAWADLVEVAVGEWRAKRIDADADPTQSELAPTDRSQTEASPNAATGARANGRRSPRDGWAVVELSEGRWRVAATGDREQMKGLYATRCASIYNRASDPALRDLPLLERRAGFAVVLFDALGQRRAECPVGPRGADGARIEWPTTTPGPEGSDVLSIEQKGAA